MRASFLTLFAIALIGCGKIDSSRSTAGVDTSAPSVSVPSDTARPPATGAGNPSRTDTAARTDTAPRLDNTAPGAAAPGNTAQADRAARLDNEARVDNTPRNETARSDGAREPDNTGVNQRDTNRATREPKLPIDQKENQADIDVTAKIRQRVLKVDGLSVNARNAKIITADGKVTLRGPVESQQERDTIARIAREVAGDGNVEDQLEVKTAGNSTSGAATNP